MGWLYRFHLKRALRDRGDMFWSLIFPLVLATLFYASFGSGKDLEQLNAIPTGLVKMTDADAGFDTFLDSLDGGLLELTVMKEDEAEAALRNGTIHGYFVSTTEPSLTVAGTDLEESILGALLDGYLQNAKLLRQIAEKNPLQLPAAIAEVSKSGSWVKATTVSGNETNHNLSYFFALIGMACLFGAFLGMNAAQSLRADQTALALRRSTAPMRRSRIVLGEMLAVFTIQFGNVCVLLLYLHFVLHISFGDRWWLLLPICLLGSITGVAWGVFLGSLRLASGLREGLLVGSSLLMSFLAGLMFGNMKDVVAHYAPVLNKINPAALISDAFYSISVYENPARYLGNLLLLALITAVLTAVSFVQLGRDRYDSL
ncbi:MAG: ABC transporter permease [Lachnospiraceae bacterium]|nr:ABC transporter permease [Lachnospiraceae bacterium]